MRRDRAWACACRELFFPVSGEGCGLHSKGVRRYLVCFVDFFTMSDLFCVMETGRACSLATCTCCCCWLFYKVPIQGCFFKLRASGVVSKAQGVIGSPSFISVLIRIVALPPLGRGPTWFMHYPYLPAHKDDGERRVAPGADLHQRRRSAHGGKGPPHVLPRAAPKSRGHHRHRHAVSRLCRGACDVTARWFSLGLGFRFGFWVGGTGIQVQ